MKDTTAFILRFAEYTVTESGCWEASIRSLNEGRPRALIGSRRMPLARLVCFAEHGDPPSVEYHASHNCHNKACIRPDHIEWQTPEYNSTDHSDEAIAKRQAGARKGALSVYEASGKEYPMGIRYKEGRGYVARVSVNGKVKHGGPYGTLKAAVRWVESLTT